MAAESKIEARDRKAVKDVGGIMYKFVSPNYRGVPDDIVLLPIPEEHRAIVAKYFYFIEFKAPGKKPEPHQVREHERIKKLGFEVKVIDK